MILIHSLRRTKLTHFVVSIFVLGPWIHLLLFFFNVEPEIEREKCSRLTYSADPIDCLPRVYDDDVPIMMANKSSLKMPRIVHFEWKDGHIPDMNAETLKSWLRYHPTWTFMLWTDIEMKSFVEEIHSGTEMSKFYSSLPTNIFRVDFFRYLIMHHFGGIYADIDVEILRSLEPILNHHSCIIAREPEPYGVSIKMDTPLLASNIFLMSIPGHPFWPFLVTSIRKQKATSDVLRGVGPIAVTKALAQYSRLPPSRIDACVFLSPSLYFYPPPHPKGDPIHLANLRQSCFYFEWLKSASNFAKRICRVFRQENRIDWSDVYKHNRFFNDSFAIHRTTASWNADYQVRKEKSFIHISKLFPGLVYFRSLVPHERQQVMDPYTREKLLLTRV